MDHTVSYQLSALVVDGFLALEFPSYLGFNQSHGSWRYPSSNQSILLVKIYIILMFFGEIFFEDLNALNELNFHRVIVT